MLPELQALRRKLHQIPEFGLELPNTLKVILDEISPLGEITLGKSITSAVLHIKGDLPGPTVLLRADMDALAVIEETGVPYASTNGFMHACGHDLHMAMGVGAAKILASRKSELKGEVIIFFQPGEEGHHGADVMIEEQALMVSGSKPIRAYGLHVFSSYPLGMMGSRSGPLMASAGDLLVTVTGSGGHGSMPWLSKDPISVLNEIMSSLQTMVTKRFSAFDPVIVNIGWVRAGDTATTNVIPETASFGATVRVFSEENATKLKQYTQELVDSIATGFGLSATVEFTRATKVLMNDPKAISSVEKVTSELFGASRYINLPTPIAGGEDFASIVSEIPGAFVFMGACPPGTDHTNAATNHSNKAVFDDSVLGDGAALLASLAVDALS
ncbi:AbgB Metal-dependent amidase/aminoacylase/carboxypeptidase [Microbacteriaceae bacterium]